MITGDSKTWIPPIVEFVYALHPAAFNRSDVVLRFLTKAGARKGTAAKVLIDDVLIYAAESDIFPPIALEPRITSIDNIRIEFSEPVGENAFIISNYSINSIPLEGEVEISTEGDVVILHLASPISIGKYYELGIANVEDVAGNVMTPVTSEIIYNPLQKGLVITEIMYDEPPVEQNDDLEFIELYNVTDEPIELGGLRIKGGITSGRLPEYTLEPGAYWVTAKNAAAFTGFFGIPAYEWHGANLSNDEPETIYIINTDHHSEVRIDLVTYNSVSPWPEGAAGGGHSLELCDPYADNNDAANWSEATRYSGTYKDFDIFASPGKGCCTLVADAGSDKMVSPGPSKKLRCTQLSVAVSGGTSPFTYEWISHPELSGSVVEVCPGITTTYTVKVTDAEGCSDTDEVTVFTSEISEKEKISMCYKDRTIKVKPASVQALLAQGAVLGACGEVSGTVTGEELANISVFPNPASGPVSMYFQPVKATDASVEIFNFSGQFMTSLLRGRVTGDEVYIFEVDTTNWPAGSYLVIVKMAGATYSRQLVVN